MTPPPRPPAHVAPYVEALGHDLAVEFLLRFGGGELPIPEAPTLRGRLVAALGPEAAARLAAVRDRLPRRVPVASPWLARALAAQGLPVAEIARHVRASDVTVRNWIKRSS